MPSPESVPGFVRECGGADTLEMVSQPAPLRPARRSHTDLRSAGREDGTRAEIAEAAEKKGADSFLRAVRVTSLC